jgi:flagellar secretion chaperone FliS
MSGTNMQAGSYLATKVMTASPAELRMMLLEGAAKFCRQGRQGLVDKNFEAAFNGFQRTRNILVELLGSMKPDPADPSLVEKMRALYGYLISRLITASHEKDVQAADEVIQRLDYECETWRLLMQQLQQSQRKAASNNAYTNANATERVFSA